MTRQRQGGGSPRAPWPAMVLAAGLATRLRPLSERVPKPLLPILGRPLLGKILEELVESGAGPIVVNTHHLPKQVERYVSELPFAQRVALSHEPKILGSGGGLVKAREHLDRGDLFLYYNGDELSDLRAEEVLAHHRSLSPEPMATIALADSAPINNVLVSEGGDILDIVGRLKAKPPPKSRLLAFMGLIVFSRRIFDFLPSSGFCSVRDGLTKAMAGTPGCARAFIPRGRYWRNIETVDDYLDAHEDILVRRRLPWPDAPKGEPFFLAPTAAVSTQAELKGFVSIGPGCVVHDGAELRDCVLLKDAIVAAGAKHARAVIGPGFVAAAGEGP